MASPLLNFIAKVKSSIKDPLEAIKKVNDLRGTLTTDQEKLIADMALFFLMVESYARPSLITFVDIDNTKTPVMLNWSAAFETHLAFTIDSQNPPYIHADAANSFSWTPGELTIDKSFNIISLLCLGSREVLLRTSQKLIDLLYPTPEIGYAPLFWVAQSLPKNINKVLGDRWFMSPSSLTAKECFIGGMYRHSVNVGLQMYTRAKTSFLNSYYNNQYTVFCDKNIGSLSFTDYPETKTVDNSVGYALIAYICGLLHGAEAPFCVSLNRPGVLGLNTYLAYQAHSIKVQPYPIGAAISVNKLWDLIDQDVQQNLQDWCGESRQSPADFAVDLENRCRYLRYLSENTVATFDTRFEPTTPLQVLMQTSHAWTRIVEPDLTSITQWVL